MTVVGQVAAIAAKSSLMGQVMIIRRARAPGPTLAPNVYRARSTRRWRKALADPKRTGTPPERGT